MRKPKPPLCPCCGDVSASDRQAARPDLCRWCGYNHATGEVAQLVPASSSEENDYFGSDAVVVEPSPEPLPEYEQCAVCDEGVAQLIEHVEVFPYGAGAEAVELTCTVPAYSCPRCPVLYSAPGSEEAIQARVDQYLADGVAG